MAPRVDKSRCIGCGTCVAVCPTGVFEIQEGVSVVVHPDACIHCRACVLNCPENAISFKKTK